MTQNEEPMNQSGEVELTLNVNGVRRTCHVLPGETLLSALRNRLGLTGTKEGCGQGECGACTVLVNKEPICSCTTFALQCEGAAILTIEGLEVEGRLHPLQQAFLDSGAVQCGYCTPGMVLSAHALLLKNNDPTDSDIKEALAGNLCRCTGYTKIIEAVRKAAPLLREVGKDEEGDY